MCWLCLQVLRLVMTLGAAAVRGNHDDQALSAYHKFRRAEREVLVTCDLNPTQLHLAVNYKRLACRHAKSLLGSHAPSFKLTAILHCVKVSTMQDAIPNDLIVQLVKVKFESNSNSTLTQVRLPEPMLLCISVLV